MNLKKITGLAIAVVVIFGWWTPASLADSTGCSSSLWKSIYPDECIIDDQDGARVIAGYRLNESVDTCDDSLYGIVLSTGHDDVGWIKIKSAKPSGEMQSGNVEFEFWLVQQCLSWTDAYSVELNLSGPDGYNQSAAITSSEFTYRKKFSGSISSYCYTNICGDTRMNGVFNLPENSSHGFYKLSVRIKSNWAFSSKDKTFTYSNQLFYGSQISPVATNPNPSDMTDVGQVSICGGDLKEKFSAIKGYEKKLHPLHKKLIKQAINSSQDVCGIDLPVRKLVCEGVYFGGTANAKIAKNKAKIACDYARTIQKNLPVIVKTKSTKAKNYNGYVFATFSFD